MRASSAKPTLVMAWGGRLGFDRDWLRRELARLQPECVVWNGADGANRFTVGWQLHHGRGAYLRILRSAMLAALPELAATWRLTVVALPETAADRRVIAAAERLGATILRPASREPSAAGPPREAMTAIDGGIIPLDGSVDELVTVTAAADRLGVSRSTINRWIGRGLLPARLVAGRRWVRLADAQTAQIRIHAGAVVPAWRREPQRAGWRLRRLREAAQLTQLELARRSGLTNDAISILERGRRAPQATTVRALAQALGVPPAAFVTGTATEQGLPVAEAATRLGVPPARVQRWLLSGQLPGWKVSGQWRVATRSVMALAESGRLRGRSRRLDPRFRGGAARPDSEDPGRQASHPD